MKKICRVCKEEKLLTEFFVASSNPDGFHNKRMKQERREKHLARVKVATEVLAGRLKSEPCVECGNPKTDAHHEDYTKPLEVIWLCRKHHSRLHASRKNNH